MVTLGSHRNLLRDLDQVKPRFIYVDEGFGKSATHDATAMFQIDPEFVHSH